MIIRREFEQLVGGNNNLTITKATKLMTKGDIFNGFLLTVPVNYAIDATQVNGSCPVPPDISSKYLNCKTFIWVSLQKTRILSHVNHKGIYQTARRHMSLNLLKHT